MYGLLEARVHVREALHALGARELAIGGRAPCAQACERHGGGLAAAFEAFFGGFGLEIIEIAVVFEVFLRFRAWNPDGSRDFGDENRTPSSI